MASSLDKKDYFSQNDFKKLSVSEKFNRVFNRLHINLIIIFAVIIIIDLVAVFNLKNIYSVYYEQNSQQGEVRITIQALAKYYLWAIAATDAAERNDQISSAGEKIQELNDGLDSLSKVYSGDLTNIYQHIKNIDTADDKLVEMFNSGASTEEIYSYYKSTVNEAIKVVVQDFKEVGISAKAQAGRAYSFALI